MEISQQYLNKFVVARPRTETQILCDEIYEFFSKKIKYSQLLGFCKYQGTVAIREQFEEFKKFTPNEKKTLQYFIGILKKNKTVFYET